MQIKIYRGILSGSHPQLLLLHIKKVTDLNRSALNAICNSVLKGVRKPVGSTEIKFIVIKICLLLLKSITVWWLEQHS